MDIKVKIEEIVEKITSNETLMAEFEKNAIKVVEELIGVDLPDDQVKKIVDGVKEKIKIDGVS